MNGSGDRSSDATSMELEPAAASPVIEIRVPHSVASMSGNTRSKRRPHAVLVFWVLTKMITLNP